MRLLNDTHITGLHGVRPLMTKAKGAKLICMCYLKNAGAKALRSDDTLRG